MQRDELLDSLRGRFKLEEQDGLLSAEGIAILSTEIDADFHFAAAIIADDNGDEYVHVTESGPYFDHVFLNLHEEGLSSVEELMDADEFDPSILVAVYSDQAYENVSKQTRIEWMPFFQNPIARSLRELHDRLVARTSE